MKFKVGDKVRIKEGTRYWMEDSDMNPKDIVGTVSEVFKDGGWPIEVKWDEKHSNSYNESDLELDFSSLKHNIRITNNHLLDLLLQPYQDELKTLNLDSEIILRENTVLISSQSVTKEKAVKLAEIILKVYT